MNKVESFELDHRKGKGTLCKKMLPFRRTKGR